MSDRWDIKPRVMGILNVTDDSFFAGSRVCGSAEAERRAAQMVAEGADIIDIGGYSSRPGAADVPVEQEWERVRLGVEVVRSICPEMEISVDTFRAEIVGRALDAFGRVTVNDISAGEADSRMLEVVAGADVPYIAMHMRGTPQTMQSLTQYGNVVEDIRDYFAKRIEKMLAAGIRRENIILDPGFGFAKTPEQNYALLGGLHRICELGFPVLAGVSRKSMIYRPLEITPDEALPATQALHWESLRQGADILRVHDVKEARQTVRMYEIFREQNR